VKEKQREKRKSLLSSLPLELLSVPSPLLPSTLAGLVSFSPFSTFQGREGVGVGEEREEKRLRGSSEWGGSDRERQTTWERKRGGEREATVSEQTKPSDAVYDFSGLPCNHPALSLIQTQAGKHTPRQELGT